MKKYLLLLLLLAMTISNSTNAQLKEEFRGVKLTNVDSPVLFTDDNIAEAMDHLASLNINAVLTVVLNGGWTLYPSETMDTLFGKSIHPNFYNRDPLERVVIEAHRVGIEVYPWFEYGFASWYSGGTPPFGGHILDKFPDWALRTKDGKICTKNGFDWMAATNPDVQDFMNSLVMEVVDNYDIDGVEFSDRIPALPIEGGYDSVTVALYKAEHNGQKPPANYYNDAWKKWRARKLSDWLKNVGDLVKAKNPNVFISSSPSLYPWGYDNYHQDAQTWLDEDIVDHFIPQLYRYNFADYLYELNRAVEQASPNNLHKVFAGLLMNIGTGSNAYLMDTDYLLDALQANRDNGISGDVYFFYEGFNKEGGRLGDTLKATFYKDPAKVPDRPTLWRPKAEITNETDDMAVKKGDWQTYQMSGFRDGILRTNDNQNPTSIDYNFEVPFDAWFDVYVHYSPNTIWTQQAVYKVNSTEGEETIVVNQADLTKKGWQKLTTAKIDAGYKKVVSLDNSQLEDGKYLCADAVMIMINRKLSPDVIVNVKEEKKTDVSLPTEYKLYQSYPNPFNPSTVIKFSLPESANVKLRVYNALGEEVRTLVNESLHAGEHQVSFDGSNLSSGIYLYQLITDKVQLSGKMMLMK